MTFVVIVLILGSFMLILPPVQAQNLYSEFERGLKLSDPQRAQIEDIRNRYIDDWQLMRRESALRRMELRELGRDPNADSGRISRVQSELHEIDTARNNSYLQYRSEVSRTLNERQKEQYNSFCNQEKGKGVHRRGLSPGRHGR